MPGYRLEGRERELLAATVQQMNKLQADMLVIAEFIARRQGLDLQRVVFDTQALAFVEVSEVPQEVARPS